MHSPNCGSVGICNLELRHIGKKVCQANKAKRDKEARNLKNATILTFFTKPKATFIPSTVVGPALVQNQRLSDMIELDGNELSIAEESTPVSEQTPSETSNGEFLDRFFDVIAKLPQ